MSNLARAASANVIEANATSIMDVITRAASDPTIDVNKLERLMGMYERLQAQQAKVAFTEAKIAMRPVLPEVTMKGMIRIPSKDTTKPPQETPFARFEDIHAIVMPILTEYGFDLKYKNGLAPDGKVRVTTILSHIGGHEESTDFDLPHDSSGSKNAVQAVGSSTQYGKRYGTVSILNLRISGEDDDGKRGGANTVSDDQEANIIALIEDVKADKPKFLKFFGVSRIEDIPAAEYSKAIALLEKKRGQ